MYPASLKMNPENHCRKYLREDINEMTGGSRFIGRVSLEKSNRRKKGRGMHKELDAWNAAVNMHIIDRGEEEGAVYGVARQVCCDGRNRCT